MIVAGVDYSLSSPAIVVHDGDEWKYENCTFYYLVRKDKYVQETGQYQGDMYPEYANDYERYDNLARWSSDIIFGADVCFIEGYAFGAVGRVFQIAENAGLLKYMIWKNDVPIETVPPTVIKKFATGKGNSNKTKMEEAFVEETKINLNDKHNIHTQSGNPSNDIIDAYYIAKYGFMLKTGQITL